MTYFSPDQLKQMVAQVIPAATDATHHQAIVGGFNANGVQVVASFEKPMGAADWVFTAALAHDWSGDNSVGAQVILKW